jgi:hypothetical protein
MTLFETIARVQPKLHGWCSPEKAATLAAAVLAYRPEVVVEIGVFGGSSLIPLALAAKEIGRCKVIAIDPWLAVASVIGQINVEDQRYWSDQQRHETVYNDFLRVVSELGLSNIVDIRRAKSDDVEPPPNIGVFHLDGNHSDQAVKDVERFFPKCLVGSLAFVDDEGWAGGGVSRAIAKAKSMGFKELYKLGTGCVMQRL